MTTVGAKKRTRTSPCDAHLFVDSALPHTQFTPLSESTLSANQTEQHFTEQFETRPKNFVNSRTINASSIQRNLLSKFGKENLTLSNLNSSPSIATHTTTGCRPMQIGTTSQHINSGRYTILNSKLIEHISDDTNDKLDITQGDIVTDIIIGIKNMLDTHNRYAQKFRMSRDKLHSSAVCDLKLKLISGRQSDGRLYNLPNATEVATLIIGDEHIVNNRDIIIEKQTSMLQRINELHPAYLPLQYPLLYPHGEDGYRPNILHKDNPHSQVAKRNKVTMCEYFCYRMQSRDNEAQRILHSRRLFHQWVVDGYCMIESQKLNYVRQHQQQL
ncbi:hypothetical protein JHK82_024803 [Glycine max]|nr:hypothetical protein JHK82_024803 [Glycine max]